MGGGLYPQGMQHHRTNAHTTTAILIPTPIEGAFFVGWVWAATAPQTPHFFKTPNAKSGFSPLIAMNKSAVLLRPNAPRFPAGPTTGPPEMARW